MPRLAFVRLRLLVTALLLLLAGLYVPARAETPPLRVLVTGDSMMQPLDEVLKPHVERAGGRLVSDRRPATGLTNPVILDWVQHARKQARRHRQRATVMFIGANDSNPLRTEDGREVNCCRRGWIDAYARRVAKIMRIWRRDSRAYVYWLTLPTPVEPRVAQFAAINYAIRQAAAEVGPQVRVVDTVPAISPGNRFRRRVRYRGRRVVVRDRDGVHLTRAGARIASDLVRRAMRSDGLL